MPEKDSKSKVLQILLIAIILIVFGITAWTFFQQYDRFNVENLRQFVDGFGPWAPLAYVFLYTISSPIPLLGTVLSAAGGLVFGLFAGTILAVISATFSSLIPFYLSRSLGREWVQKRIKSDQLKATYQKSEGKGGFLFILMMRLIPVLPWEIQNYVAGLTKVKIPVFLLGTLLGIIPGSFALNFLGDSISDPTSWQFYAAIGINIVAFLVPAGYIFIKGQLDKRQGGKIVPEDRGETEGNNEME